MNIQEVLKGTQPGKLQSVGYMQIIPLISELVDDNFISPEGLEIGTSGYGNMIIKNTDNGLPTILPFGAGYIVNQSAQDHATPTAKIIRAKQQVSLDNAACIQQNQGGLISKGNHKMSIIPWAIKEVALTTRKKESYSKLWPSITEFNTSLGLMDRGHLEDFLNKFKSDLDEFVGQFEIVHNQIGAIILMNGHVMGIERTPNYNFWKQLWRPLIRESYGSLAIQYAKQFGDSSPAPKTRVPLKSTGINSLKDIKEALKEAENKESKIVRKLIRRFIKNQFVSQEDDKINGFSTETISHNQFVGQIVRNEEKIVYASLITKGNWMKNRDWNEAEDFEI